MLLNYTDDGPGPAVVLLHGFPFDHSIWDAQRSTIGRVYRLILPDLRGHGRSAAPEGVYSMDDLADDVLELLDGLGLREPVVLGGLSMGGYVAQSIAARDPDRLRGLILANTRAKGDSPEAARNRLERADEIERTGDTGPFLEGMLTKLFAAKTRQEHPEVVRSLADVMAATPPRTVAACLRGMAERPDRTPMLRSLATPTLILAGEQDQIVPADEAREMADAIPSARLVTLPEVGHLAPLEDPRATDAALSGFLDGLR